MRYRIGNYVFLAAVLILVLGSAAILLPAYYDYRRARSDLTRVQSELARQEEEMLRLRRDIRRLRTDYRAIEKVAREKFGYCRDEETIYHFDDPLPQDRTQ